MSVTELNFNDNSFAVEGDSYGTTGIWLHVKNIQWWTRTKHNLVTNGVFLVQRYGMIGANSSSEYLFNNQYSLCASIRLG